MSDIPPYAAPEPPARAEASRGLTGLLLAVVVAALASVGACVVLVVAMDDDEGGSEDAAADIAPPDCRADETGDLGAVLRVTNPTSKRSDYVITVAFADAAGDEVDATTLTVDGLEAGDTTSAIAVTETDMPEGGFTCEVTDVDRRADEG